MHYYLLDGAIFWSSFNPVLAETLSGASWPSKLTFSRSIMSAKTNQISHQLTYWPQENYKQENNLLFCIKGTKLCRENREQIYYVCQNKIDKSPTHLLASGKSQTRTWPFYFALMELSCAEKKESRFIMSANIKQISHPTHYWTQEKRKQEHNLPSVLHQCVCVCGTGGRIHCLF